MHMRICVILALLSLSLLSLADPPALTPPTRDEVAAVRAQGRYLATIMLANGKAVELVLEGTEMPFTVANFVKLAQARFYDSQTFYHIENQSGGAGMPAVNLIQSGDPNNDGTGHAGYALNLEISPWLRHKRGTISMFHRSTPDSGGSQFFITRSDLQPLDGRFAAFGWVKTGMEILDAVQQGDKITSITIAPYAGAEPCPILAAAKPPLRYPPTKDEVAAAQQQGRFLATITMENDKTITLVLEGKEMPLTVANFVKLAQAQFYNGLSFHQVETEPGFQLIQGGDPNGDGSGNPGYGIKLEQSKLIHKQGAIAMIHSQDPNSAGCQFYITCCDVPDLDGNYAVFGWVKDGFDVVQQVKAGDKMKSVTIAPYAGTEPCPMLAAEKPTEKPKPADTVKPKPADTVKPNTRVAPTAAEIAAAQKQGRYLVTITLANGKKAEVVLEGKEMPLTVANFVKLAKTKFYDGLSFHRVETGTGFQLIQGGDPEGNGVGGPGYEIKFEKSKLIHKKGAIAMARSQDPDSAGSQFYVIFCDIPQLDGNYAVFGWVKSGLDALRQVKVGDKMKSVTVAPYPGQEPSPIKGK